MAVTWSRQDHTANLLVNDRKETFQVDADETIDLPLPSKQYFNIGKKDETVNRPRFKGYVRDVKLFEKGLSDNEVATIKGVYLTVKSTAFNFFSIHKN